MKRCDGRGEEINGGRGIKASLETIRFVVGHGNARGRKLVLQLDKNTGWNQAHELTERGALASE